MASVIYNSCAVIPAPMVTIASDPIIAGDQRRLGKTYTVTMNGFLISYKGSPASVSMAGANWGGFNNQFWIVSDYPPDESPPIYHKLFNIESKQEALENLFSTDGQWLEFDSPDGSSPLKCQIKNAKINYAESSDNWVNRCPYTITCETDILYLNGEVYQGVGFSQLIQSSNESWDIQPSEAIKTFSVSHTVSAVGKRAFDDSGNLLNDSWQTAKQFVESNLVLGFAGTSAFSTTDGQTIFNQSSLASGIINFSSLSPFNFSRTENVDELGGSYSVTESWVLATGSGTDIYSINLNQIDDEPYTTTQASIQGTLRGFYTNLFDYDTRMLSAEWMWNQLEGVNILNRVNSYVQSTYASGITFNAQPAASTLDYNPNDGTITYAQTFNNKLYQGDAYDSFTVSSKKSAESYKSQFTIQGAVKGRKYQTDTDPTIAYARALAYFQTINNSYIQFTRVVNNIYFPYASGLGLQPDPIERSWDDNQADGTISYSYIFDNRINDSGVNYSDKILEEYTINKSFSVEDGITKYTIQGFVQGLNINDSADPRGQMNAIASGYFYNYVVPNMYNRVALYYHTSLPNQLPQSTEIGIEPYAGKITYNYGFDNKQPPLISGVFSEHIVISTVNKNATVNVFAQIPIISRQAGPIAQNMATTVGKERTINIEAVLMPLTGVYTDLLAEYNTIPNYDYWVNEIMPNAGTVYTTQDTDSYDPRFRRYSRTTSWWFQ